MRCQQCMGMQDQTALVTTGRTGLTQSHGHVLKQALKPRKMYFDTEQAL